jgi:hypothetical protein
MMNKTIKWSVVPAWLYRQAVSFAIYSHQLVSLWGDVLFSSCLNLFQWNMWYSVESSLVTRTLFAVTMVCNG